MIMIDLSGTIHVGMNPIKGCVEAIESLRTLNPSTLLRFVTNSSKLSPNDLLKKLHGMGFQFTV